MKRDQSRRRSDYPTLAALYRERTDFCQALCDGNGVEKEFLTDTCLVARHGLIERVLGLGATCPLLVLRAVQLWIVET